MVSLHPQWFWGEPCELGERVPGGQRAMDYRNPCDPSGQWSCSSAKANPIYKATH